VSKIGGIKARKRAPRRKVEEILKSSGPVDDVPGTEEAGANAMRFLEICTLLVCCLPLPYGSMSAVECKVYFIGIGYIADD
jgi:hypothetical protein